MPINLNSTLKIGLVTETYPPEVNGVAMTLGRLVDGLLSSGNQVDLYRPKQANDLPAPNNENMFTEHLIRGIHLPMYKDMQLGMPAGNYFRKTWSKNKPDVLYVATEGPLGWSAIKQANQLGIPVVSGFHTNFHAYSKHYRLGWISPIILKYLRHLHNKTYCTLVPTHEMADLLHSHGFHRAEVMQRGVDTEIFNPAHRDNKLRNLWGIKENELVCLYVGRIAAEKNIQEAVNTIRTLKKHKNIRFVLVGDGPLKNQLSKENPDFIFTGTKRGLELSSHYASSDVFLFPSHTETFGNVITEAMASGLAVVSFNRAAAKEHITDWKNGVLANTYDENSFRNTTEQLLNQPDLIKKMGESAADYTRDLGWASIVQQFKQLLSNACNSISARAIQ